MAYKTILFDADMTLFDFKSAEKIALDQCLRHNGYPSTAEIIRLYSQINDDCWKAFERGEISREVLVVQRFQRLFDAIGVNGDAAAFHALYCEQLGEVPLLLDGALELCRNLCQSYRLYIITNGVARTQRLRFAKSEITPCFTDLFISEEMGCQKPHKAYFDYVAAHVPDWDPESTLVVGDSLSSDISGAIQYGLDCCWYNPQRLPYTLEQPCTYEIHCLEELFSVLGKK